MNGLDILAVAVGGAAGALLRTFAAHLLPWWPGQGLPLATIAVNLLGCSFIGIAWHLSDQMSDAARGFVVFGLLGALTTFSTYGLDLLRLLHSGERTTAAVYFVISNVGGLACVWLGWRTARLLTL